MKSLFGADGIRGTIDQYPFRAEDLVRIGQALAKWWLDRVHEPVVLLGTDTRESNQRIKMALVDGLTRAGVEIWDTGILPTAAVSFIVASNPDLAGGVMVSASHNPIWENGIKVFVRDGTKISDDSEHEIEELFFSEDLQIDYQIQPAKVRSRTDFLQQYIQEMVKEFETVGWRKDKILIDCANGASYLTVQAAFSNLGIHYALHNAFPDGTNINFGVGSEYVRKFPREFAAEIQKSGASLGLALDGDADRVVFVDQDGLFYDGDMLLAILVFFLRDQGILKDNRIIITQMSNSGLADHLSKFEIQTQLVRNGDKYITDALLRENLILGGEQVGHIIVRNDQFHVTGDGLRTALWILNAFSQNPGLSLRELMHGMRKWPQINVSVLLGRRMFSKTEEIPGLANLKAQVQGSIKDLSRFECRPASTEPVYRIMLEAKETSLSVLVQQAMRLACHIQKHYGRLNEPVEILDCINGGRIDPKTCFPE